MKRKKEILVFGTFDFLHAGHFNLIYRASLLGNVHIALRPESEVSKIKNVTLFQSNIVRKNNLKKLIMVDTVDVKSWNVKNAVKLVEKYNIDYIVAGSDHKESEIHKETAKISGCKLQFFDRTDGISSTELRKSVDKKIK